LIGQWTQQSIISETHISTDSKTQSINKILTVNAHKYELTQDFKYDQITSQYQFQLIAEGMFYQLIMQTRQITKKDCLDSCSW